MNLRSRQKGLALAVILWFIAAMLLLVAGIMGLAKQETRLARLHLQNAQAEALGDGESLLAMAEIVRSFQGKTDIKPVYYFSNQYGEIDVRGRAHPVTGLVDLNTAPPALFRDLLIYVGELDPAKADILVERFKAWREGPTQEELLHFQEGVWSEARPGYFLTKEDILSIEGIDRPLYEKIREALYVGLTPISAVNINHAPGVVLQLIAKGDVGLRDEWQAQQQGEGIRSLPQGLEYGLQSVGNAAAYKIDVRVRFPDGQVYQRTRWVNFQPHLASSLPWLVERTEPVVSVQEFEFHE